MSDTSNTKKKRPPKLSSLVASGSTSDRNLASTVDATSMVEPALSESQVQVTLDGLGKILVSPSNLIVLRQLGRGQYGIVEEVSHLDSGFKFAVKRVALLPGNSSERSQLLMDVDILVKSSHCLNIIKFFGSFIWEGDLWILMELMDCSLDKFYKLAHHKPNSPVVINPASAKLSLSSHQPCTHLSSLVTVGNCDQCNPIPERVLSRIAADILNALNYLYSIKVIHRDIKPSNILINKAGIIKLCDFGISGYLVNSVARTYDAGCRPYMAPERIDPPRDRAGYDIKSDVWSFGITLLEIASGRYPYNHARGFFEQLKSICSDEPPRLPRGRFSTDFEEFLELCLKRDYQDRPKYDVLLEHPFIGKSCHLDIGDFTKRVLVMN